MIQPGTKGGFKEPPLLTLKYHGGEMMLDEEGIKKISKWSIEYKLKQFTKDVCINYGIISEDEYKTFLSNENVKKSKLKYTDWNSLSRALARAYWNSDRTQGYDLPKRFQNREFYAKSIIDFIASKIDKDGNICCEVSNKKLECKEKNPLTLSLDRIDNNIGHVPGNLKVTFVALNLWRKDNFDSLEEAWESYSLAFNQT